MAGAWTSRSRRGVTNGQRIRLAGQGGRGSDGAPPGDLHLIVQIADHPRYRVEGRDIHTTLPLAPWEAALGATVPIDTPGGEAKLKVPPGTSSGRRLRLRGRGMRNPSGPAGDFFAEVRIMVPSHAHRRGATPVRAARCRIAVRPEEALVIYALVRPARLDLDSYARVTGLHPEIVRRLVTLGLLEPDRDARGELCFTPPRSWRPPAFSGCTRACPSTTPRSAW
ncbi:DnaJ C-terminal domain-containing protein [Nonomuraea ferruginea]